MGQIIKCLLRYHTPSFKVFVSVTIFVELNIVLVVDADCLHSCCLQPLALHVDVCIILPLQLKPERCISFSFMTYSIYLYELLHAVPNTAGKHNNDKSIVG